MVHADEALRLDPTAPILNNLVAITRVYARDFEGGLAAFHRTFELEPSFAVSHAQLGGTYVAMARFAEAEAELARGTASYGERYLGLSYAFQGRRQEAIELVERLEARARNGFLSPATRGFIWVAVGEKDRGYALLREACAQNDWRLRDAKIHPVFDPLRKDEQFHEILKCVNLE
jgi:tetratricopeptide (TPR) repeat protein